MAVVLLHMRRVCHHGRSAGDCISTASDAKVHNAVEGIEQRLRELPDVNQVILAGLEVRVQAL